MTTNASDLNYSTNAQNPDFDGFLTEPPYCYGWTTNAQGVKLPVFPYVISILGHLNLKKLGVPDDKIESSTQLMKNTLAMYLEQIIKRWEKRHFWQKKLDIPLIILINIADKIGELITDVVEKLQEKYPFLRLIAVLPLPKNEFINQIKTDGETNENINAFIKRYDDFNKNENGKTQKFIWELSEREMPHIANQPTTKMWRMFNEFVAQHSHLMIVFWQGEKDLWKDQDDSLTWVVRYKLEGYPGLSRNEQTDLITYPATGPVLHIQTDAETLQKSDGFLPVRYYSDRAKITEEIDRKRVLIISDHKFWDLEKLRHSWLGKKFSDIGNRPEIYNNFEILKNLNYACQYKKARQEKEPLNNPPLRSYIEDYILERYKQSNKPIDKSEIPETDKPTGQLIAYYCIVKQIAEFYKRKTYGLINLFCSVFLILLVFNAALLFLNDICIMGFGVNIFHLCHYYIAQWIPHQNLSFEGFSWEQFTGSIQHFLPSIASDENLNHSIESQEINVSRIIGAFLLSCLVVFLSIITIIHCCCNYAINVWHYKYHQFRTLADCLQVQIFWKIASMDYSVSANFRSHQIPAVDWLLMALNGLNVTIPNSERIESTSKLKERLRMLDTIWIEDNIHMFNKIFKTKLFSFSWSALSLISRITAFLYVSVIPFLITFFIADIGVKSFCGISIKGSTFKDSVIAAIVVTSSIWILFLLYLFFRFILKMLEKHLKWAEEFYDGSKGFWGNIYRRIKQKDYSKNYFLAPFISKLIQIFIIGIVCFGAIFELYRSNLIYAAVQNPSFEHLYNPAMATRLVIQIFISGIAVWWLYKRMGLFSKSRRRIEKLYYPFSMADYSIDTLLEDEKAFESINSSMWEKISSWLGYSSNPNNQNSQGESDDEAKKVDICQQVLLELGQEVLAKRAEWLLAVTDRNLKSPK